MTGLTWTQVERASKHFAALVWFTLELWRWGARPAALTSITAILAASEAARMVVKSRPGNGSSGGSNGRLSQLPESESSSHG